MHKVRRYLCLCQPGTEDVLLLHVLEQLPALCGSPKPRAKLSELFSWRPSQAPLQGHFSELQGCPGPKHSEPAWHTHSCGHNTPEADQCLQLEKCLLGFRAWHKKYHIYPSMQIQNLKNFLIYLWLTKCITGCWRRGLELTANLAFTHSCYSPIEAQLP